MSILQQVLTDPELVEKPPVLLDVGASGGVHADWRVIAPHAVCIAFDADQREMGYVEKSTSGFKHLVVYRSILHDRDLPEADFYLTRSPHCSSVLPPLADRLANWAFGPLFDVVEKTRLPATTLTRVLAEQKLDRVDWFKSDSQGMDLRLFRSLGQDLVRRVLVAQFEPGIIDAYEGEDDLASVLSFAREKGFWLADATLRGSQRITTRGRGELPRVLARNVQHLVRTSPGWAEVTYLNAFSGEWSRRDLLLGWVLTTLREQHGFALELALRGRDSFSGTLFPRLRDYSCARIRRKAYLLPVAAGMDRLRSLIARLF